jgi:steroid 5-alpha reductase family enzyme
MGDEMFVIFIQDLYKYNMKLTIHAVGTFLFSRITSENGQDSRFDKIRTSPSKFMVAFFAQATWVSLVMLPVTALNSIPPATFAKIPYFTPGTLAGIALWLFGFSFEVTADRQKSQWMAEKKEKKHDEDFLTRGLWSKSRHPNYFGEISMWTGIAVTAGSILASTVGQKALGWSGSPGARVGALAVAGVSPAFTTFLLTQVSGIPMSEGKYDKKYGDRKDYQEWKENTPVLFPKLF